MKAIVTLTIGKEQEDMFNKFSKKSWEKYCKTFGFNLIVINESFDKSERAENRSPAWQKLLILSQPWSNKYDQIVWIDADVIINNNNAYDITNNVPVEKIGAVEAYSIPTREIYDIALQRCYSYWRKNNITFGDNSTPSSYYINRGVPGKDLNEVVQTGVIVCSPTHHRQIFEHTYYNYEKNNLGFEMAAMSYELLMAKLVYWISPRFNFSVYELLAAFYPDVLLSDKSVKDKLFTRLSKYMGFRAEDKKNDALKNIYSLSIFLHFAGCKNWMIEFDVE